MTQLGLAWYGREDWEQLREIADDRDKLDDTYEDWERQALKMIHDLEAVPRAKMPYRHGRTFGIRLVSTQPRKARRGSAPITPGP